MAARVPVARCLVEVPPGAGVGPRPVFATSPRIGVARTKKRAAKLANRLEAGAAHVLLATVTETARRWYVSFVAWKPDGPSARTTNLPRAMNWWRSRTWAWRACPRRRKAPVTGGQGRPQPGGPRCRLGELGRQLAHETIWYGSRS